MTDKLYLSPPHMSGHESRAAADAIASNWVAPVGPSLDAFESSVALKIGVTQALATASGTSALHLMLRCLGIQEGDNVLCSTLTFCASANPIAYLGARPTFIDCDNSLNIDPNLIEEELRCRARTGSLPKAMVVVDLFGSSVDIDAINEIATRYEVPVIEDAAEAMGSKYKTQPVGSRSWASFFSFNGNKIITTSGGGAICSNDQDMIQRCRHLATQAREPVAHYEHREIGYNYRMSNVLAAIGIEQLKVLEERVLARQRNFTYYQSQLEHFPGIRFIPDPTDAMSNRWLTVMLVDSQVFGASCDDIRFELERSNIESRPVWKPLHLQPCFHDAGYRGGRLAQNAFESGICLPSGSQMTIHDLERVVQVIRCCHTSRCAA